MRGLGPATRQALKEAAIAGDLVEAIALDTTGSGGALLHFNHIATESTRWACPELV